MPLFAKRPSTEGIIMTSAAHEGIRETTSMPMLNPDLERSDMRRASTKVADEMRASRTQLKGEQLRGLDVRHLVAGGAQLFAERGKAARDDPDGVFALSLPVSRLDYFVSHAWSSPRLAKYAALLSYLNLNAAIVAYLITAYLCFFFATIHFERLPDYLVMKGQGKYFDDVSLNCCAFAQVLAPLAFVFTFLFGHHFLRHGEQAFLDIACIDQRDDAAKRSGITSLGAILDRSQRMAVLLDENYMKRMWCVFELAAFAKRGSLSRMDILPLHTSMQIGALTILMLGLQAAIIPSTSNWSEHESNEASFFYMAAIMAPVMTVPWLLMIWATYVGRATSAAIEQLRHFSLADAECYSQVDRDAITELIGRWFADAGEGESDPAVGIHNFEMFVRNDVHEKVVNALGGAASSFPPICTLQLAFAFYVGWILDQTAVPEATMYHLFSGMASAPMTVVMGLVMGRGFLLTAAGMELAVTRWKWSSSFALGLIGTPGAATSILTAMISCSIFMPFSFSVNSDTPEGRMRYPDDGLEPYARRILKVQLVALLGALMVGIGVAYARAGQRA